MVEWLAEAIQRTELIETDPLARFAGFIASNQADWIDRHDEYLGSSAYFGEHKGATSK